jgi:hypothetical protein
MRGAERPAKVCWTHPFLAPLNPLSDIAAQQTFIDITDNSCNMKDMTQLLQFTGNMPLTVDLIAHLVDYEGSSSVLARWESEKTSLFSAGYDRKSNLDASIQLSMSSSRITPGARELLSLLSILPDGLSDVELFQSDLPIHNIHRCKAALLATALAYQDDKKRVRLLMPIREHIQQFSPPSHSLTQSICKHFHSLLQLYRKHDGEQLQPVINQITSNLGNLQEVLQRELNDSDSNLVETIYCTLSLNSFYRTTGRIHTRLMDCIPSIFSKLCDHTLEASFLTEALMSEALDPSPMADHLIAQAIAHFQHFKDPSLEGELCPN